MQVEVKEFHKHAHVDRIVDILIKMIGRMPTDYKAIGIKIVIFSSEQIKVKLQFFLSDDVQVNFCLSWLIPNRSLDHIH